MDKKEGESGKAEGKASGHDAGKSEKASGKIYLGERELPIQGVLAAAMLFFLLLWATLPSDITKIIFALYVLAAGLLMLVLAFRGVAGHAPERWNSLVFLISVLGILPVLLTSNDMLLVVLFSAYAVLSLLIAGKLMKLQTAIIIGLAVTAILFRVYPAMPGTGISPGHLISMDDPYYHYKQTEKLYTLGDIPNTDYTIYPPGGIVAPHNYPYYHNTYLALMTGGSLHDLTLLYPVLMAAFGAIMMYFLLRELLGDWKSGLIGGFFFATMPVILSKSSAGATEEDLMGMVLAIFSLYLLAKAFNAAAPRLSIKFAVLSGVAFFATLMAWKGVIYLYAAPIAALAAYAILSIFFKYDVWHTTRAAAIAGIIPIIGYAVTNGRLEINQAAPYGALLLFGVLAEFLRVRFFKKPDKKLDIETKYFTLLTGLVVVAAVLFLLYFGVGRIAGIIGGFYEEFAGASNRNFLVDKTISEQSALARGSIWDKLVAGYDRFGVAEALTVAMVAVGLLMVIYFMFKDRDRMFQLARAYLIFLVFFVLTMMFVWVEARLAFSQSLGFLLAGAMVGLLMPSDRKELATWRIIPLLVVGGVIIFATFYPYANTDAWDQSQRPASVDPAWFNGIKWLDENANGGYFSGDTYTNGDYVLTWWDYGHMITALSKTTVIADPLQAREDYIMQIAHFFYNETSEDDAMGWLMTQRWNPADSDGHKIKYVILDYSLIGKAGALAFLGTNYYEYPNGETAVNGVCQAGQLCQNVENGLTARLVDEEYACDEGVVCTRDSMARVDIRRCCAAETDKCCTKTLSGSEAREKGGTAALERSPGTPVYGQYQLYGKPVCRPEYVTSLEALPIVENGKVKTVSKRYVYIGDSGLPYGDGKDYVALAIFFYADGTQDMKLITANCDVVSYSEVMGLGKDLLVNIGYGQKLADGVYAPQIFVHVPEKWMDSMFTKLYLQDAKGLKYFSMVPDDDVGTYPSVKIYKVAYPDQVPASGMESLISSNTVEVGTGNTIEVVTGGVKAGDSVAVEYTGRFENGTIFDSSAGRDPLEFTAGSGQMIEGFDEAVIGMKLGEEKKVTIPPEKAYGLTGTHRLAGKTLVFDIKLVTLNGRDVGAGGSDAMNETAGVQPPKLNMTFDAYDPSLKSEYGIVGYPTVIWDCRIMRPGTSESGELDLLSMLTCARTKASPSSVCEPLGIIYSDGKAATGNQSVADLLKLSVKTTSADACPPGGNGTTIQVFYSDQCGDCAQHKALMDQLEASFGGLVDVKYYCLGDDAYCRANSLQTV